MEAREGKDHRLPLTLLSRPAKRALSDSRCIVFTLTLRTIFEMPKNELRAAQQAAGIEVES